MKEKYKPEMCEQVVTMMDEGASLVEVAAELGIHRDTLYEWIKKKGKYYNPEFAQAVSVGIQKSEAWWEKVGRTNLENKDFNYTGWYMNMKNRFKWRDKQEHEHTGGVTVNIKRFGD